jgi:glycosyltransferase involved in cell wall biosynthesis
MRIGIMLRHLAEHDGGVETYTREMLAKLFALAAHHEFFLLYHSAAQRGAFAGYTNVAELVLPVSGKLFWDQLAVPWAALRCRLDLIFNPKYSLPLLGRLPSIFVCHGLDWYTMPWGSRWRDRLSHRWLIPHYTRRASAMVAVSESVRFQLIERFGLDPSRVHTVHLGVSEQFRRPITAAQQAAVRERFELPERFFLYVGQIYPPKNFGRIVEAYRHTGPRLKTSLVLAGEHRWGSEREMETLRAPELQPWVKEIGWVTHQDLPALYSLATAVLLPSLYEGFGLPMIEAMATGCPVITSHRYSMQELAEGAALLVNPVDVGSIAAAMRRLARDDALRQQLIAAGREHAELFTWARCAEATLNLIEQVYAGVPKRNDRRLTHWKAAAGLGSKQMHKPTPRGV